MPAPPFPLCTCLLLSWLLSQFGSAWADHLYRQNPLILSFPQRLYTDSCWRQRLLFLSFAACFWILNHLAAFPAFLAGLVVSFFLPLVCCTDWEQQTIFDKMLLPFGLLALPAAFFSPLPLTDHLLAAAAGGGLFLLLAMLTRGGIGGGDIKLIFVLGLWLGTDRLLAAVLAGLLLGGLAALLLLLTGRKKRQNTFAYGPYFALNALWLYLAFLCTAGNP